MNNQIFKSTLFLGVLSLVVLGFSTVYATTDQQSVNATYYTGAMDSGHVNGRDTGVYHYFVSGRTITLNITRTTATSGAGVGLYRAATPFNFTDPCYGSVSTNTFGNQSFSRKTDVTSGGYYLVFSGGRAATTILVSGTIHD